MNFIFTENWAILKQIQEASPQKVFFITFTILTSIVVFRFVVFFFHRRGLASRRNFKMHIHAIFLQTTALPRRARATFHGHAKQEFQIGQ